MINPKRRLLQIVKLPASNAGRSAARNSGRRPEKEYCHIRQLEKSTIAA